MVATDSGYGVLHLVKENKVKGIISLQQFHKYTIGSSTEATIRVKKKDTDSHIMSVHCSLKVNNNGVTILNNFSFMNPTLVNETPIHREIALKNGDKFTVGPSKFLYENKNLDDKIVEAASKTHRIFKDRRQTEAIRDVKEMKNTLVEDLIDFNTPPIKQKNLTLVESSAKKGRKSKRINQPIDMTPKNLSTSVICLDTPFKTPIAVKSNKKMLLGSVKKIDANKTLDFTCSTPEFKSRLSSTPVNKSMKNASKSLLSELDDTNNASLSKMNNSKKSRKSKSFKENSTLNQSSNILDLNESSKSIRRSNRNTPNSLKVSSNLSLRKAVLESQSNNSLTVKNSNNSFTSTSTKSIAPSINESYSMDESILSANTSKRGIANSTALNGSARKSRKSVSDSKIDTQPGLNKSEKSVLQLSNTTNKEMEESLISNISKKSRTSLRRSVLQSNTLNFTGKSTLGNNSILEESNSKIEEFLDSKNMSNASRKSLKRSILKENSFSTSKTFNNKSLTANNESLNANNVSVSKTSLNMSQSQDFSLNLSESLIKKNKSVLERSNITNIDENEVLSPRNTSRKSLKRTSIQNNTLNLTEKPVGDNKSILEETKTSQNEIEQVLSPDVSSRSLRKSLKRNSLYNNTLNSTGKSNNESRKSDSDDKTLENDRSLQEIYVSTTSSKIDANEFEDSQLADLSCKENKLVGSRSFVATRNSVDNTELKKKRRKTLMHVNAMENRLKRGVKRSRNVEDSINVSAKRFKEMESLCDTSYEQSHLSGISTFSDVSTCEVDTSQYTTCPSTYSSNKDTNDKASDILEFDYMLVDKNEISLRKSTRLNTPAKNSSLNNLSGARKTPKAQKDPKNELEDVYGVKKLMRTPREVKSPNNDLSDVRGVRSLLKTPKIQKGPVNDLTNIKGVKSLLKTPKVQKSPINDLTNIKGVKSLLKTPKVQNSPVNDLTNIKGVKNLLKTPKVQKSPNNDLTNIKGVKSLLKTPKVQKSPINDLTNIKGVKRLLRTPKEQKGPRNDLSNIQGVKSLLRTPKQQKPPMNDLSNVAGVKKLMATPKEQKSPLNNLTNFVGVKELMSERFLEPQDVSYTGLELLFEDPVPKDALFDQLAGIKTVFKTYGRASKTPTKTNKKIEDWVNEQNELLEDNPQENEIEPTTVQQINEKNTSAKMIENKENSPAVKPRRGRPAKNKEEDAAVATSQNTRSRSTRQQVLENEATPIKNTRKRGGKTIDECEKVEKMTPVKITRKRGAKKTEEEPASATLKDEEKTPKNKRKRGEKKTEEEHMDECQKDVEKTSKNTKKRGVKKAEDKHTDDSEKDQGKTQNTRKRNVQKESTVEENTPVRNTRTRGANKKDKLNISESEIAERKSPVIVKKTRTRTKKVNDEIAEKTIEKGLENLEEKPKAKAARSKTVKHVHFEEEKEQKKIKIMTDNDIKEASSSLDVPARRLRSRKY